MPLQMGPPMDEQQMARMMEDPNVQQSLNEALSNPQIVDMLINANPMLRNMRSEEHTSELQSQD